MVYQLQQFATFLSGHQKACASDIPSPAGLLFGVLKMKRILLTQGKYAIVDDEDYDSVTRFKWSLNKDHKNKNLNYASCSLYMGKIDGKTKNASMLMHRFILRPPDNSHVDHINHNGLDNRRCNLRLCNMHQNARNSRSRCGTSRYKGVVWNKNYKRWDSQIGIGKSVIHLGSFESEVEAAMMYNAAAIRLHRGFACVNDINDIYAELLSVMDGKIRHVKIEY